MGDVEPTSGGLPRKVAQRLPSEVRRRLYPLYLRMQAWPPVGTVRFGSLRRTRPISPSFGFDRGKPIDRYFIDDFIRRHSGHPGYAPSLIRGEVLEISEARYARAFGARGSEIEKLDVLNVVHTPDTTIIGDLTDLDSLPESAYDCVICTETLIVVYELKAAIAGLYRLLKPGGTLLLTLPGISQICRPDIDLWGDYWRFTTLSARRLLEEEFDPAGITVESYGNVLAAAAFLYGLACEDLKKAELEVHDPNYQVTVTARAVKQGAPAD